MILIAGIINILISILIFVTKHQVIKNVKIPKYHSHCIWGFPHIYLFNIKTLFLRSSNKFFYKISFIIF